MTTVVPLGLSRDGKHEVQLMGTFWARCQKYLEELEFAKFFHFLCIKVLASTRINLGGSREKMCDCQELGRPCI